MFSVAHVDKVASKVDVLHKVGVPEIMAQVGEAKHVVDAMRTNGVIEMDDEIYSADFCRPN